MLSAEDISERLAPLSSDVSGIELLVLFGSHAAGHATPRSDIDVAVRAAPGTDFEGIRTQVIRLLGTDRVDVVDLRTAPPLLMQAIARRGVVLHERNAAFARFCSLALRRFNDTKKLRAARRDGLEQFLTERGLS